MWSSDPPSTRWSTPYVFLAGLVIGIILGWVFQGIVGTLVRLALLAILVAGAIYLFTLWRRSRAPARDPFEDIQEADWRDLNSRRKR